MRLLFGDSSPAPFDYDVLGLFREALTFSVRSLNGFARVRQLEREQLSLRTTVESEAKRIEELPRVVGRALEPLAPQSEWTQRAVQRIAAGSQQAVAQEIAALHAWRDTEIAGLDRQIQHEREQMLSALGALLCAHELPETSQRFDVKTEGGRYVLHIYWQAEMGVDAELVAEPPPGHALAQTARIERVAPGLELSIAEVGGFFRKETKLRPLRIDRLLLLSGTWSGDQYLLVTRANPDGTGGGFDFTFEGKQIKVTRYGEDGNAVPFELDAADIPKVHALHESWNTFVSAGTVFRTKLISATLDGDPFRDHEEPTVLVERLLEELAPHIQEIAKRSPSREELTIKRVLSDNRREEMYVARSEFRARLSELQPQQRRIFIPLGLGQLAPSMIPDAPESRTSVAIPSAPATPSVPVIEAVEIDAESIPAIAVSKDEPKP